MAEPGSNLPYWWMRPARNAELFRPGLRAATDADAGRLRALPTYVGAMVLPLAAILIPALISIVQATTPTSFQGDPYGLFELVIYDVFTESIPFMLAAFAIGVMSPAAAVVLVIVYGIGNIAAAAITEELTPVLPALFGRFASVLLLWLLVVEIPLVGRSVVERWANGGGADRSRRVSAVALGALVVTALVQAWVLAAPLLIPVVFFLTDIWGTPFLRAVYPAAYSGYAIVVPAAIIALGLLGVRYLGRASSLAVPAPAAGRSTARMAVQYVIGLALTVTLLSGTLSQVIDGVILIGGLIVGRPVALVLLQASRLAGVLVGIPWTIRLVAGTGAAIAFSVLFVGLVGASDVSRWFNVVIAIVLSYVIVEFFLGAERLVRPAPTADTVEDAGDPADGLPSVGAIVTSAVVVLQLVALALPFVALAHGWDAQGDIDPIPAGLAAGAAAGGAGMMMRKRPSGMGDKEDPSNPRPIPRPGPQLPPKAPTPKPPQPDGPLGPKKKDPSKDPDNFKWYWPPTWF